MVFHFQCPQGHLLEGDESQAGQPCQCPVCQMMFLIPPPLAQQEVPAASETAVGTTSASASFGAASTPSVSTESPPEPLFDSKKGPAVLEIMHIPCPKGHELEVPRDMLGQDVLCPHCNSQFQLKEKNSIEFKRRQEEEQARRDLRAGNAWLHWAIIIAVLVVLGLIGMIATGR